LTYFSKGIEQTQLKRDQKAALLASVQVGSCEPSHGMSKDEAITILLQDIADFDSILERLRMRVAGTERPSVAAPLNTEAIVSAENWHEERDRLVELLQGIERGAITHIDEDGLRQLQSTNAENVEVLKKRLAQLNARLGD
jgi:predicted nucleotidyltransferase